MKAFSEINVITSSAEKSVNRGRGKEVEKTNITHERALKLNWMDFESDRSLALPHFITENHIDSVS